MLISSSLRLRKWRRHKAFGFVVLGWLLAMPALAQDNTEAPKEHLLKDPRVGEKTLAGPSFRLDPTSGTLRAGYRLDDSPEISSPDPVAVARAWLHRHGESFGKRSTTELELEYLRSSPGGHHASFQQVVDGLPIQNRTIKVNLNRQLEVTMVVGLLEEPPQLVPSNAISVAQATRHLADALATGTSMVGQPERVLYPSQSLRPAWSAVVTPENESVSWRVIIDAETGEPLEITEMALRHAEVSELRSPVFAPTRTQLSSGSAHPLSNRVDGRGLVFDPDPLTSAGVEYGGAYTDQDDFDVSELNAERVLVDLPDISQGQDGMFRLEGPYVRIVGDRASPLTPNYEPPVEADPAGFQYTRADDRFEAVNIYYHIDRSQRYIQELGFTNLQNGPIPANPYGAGEEDNSYYEFSSNLLVFGYGGIDDGEDADPIVHEYGHAILQAASPNVGLLEEGRSIHEGWSDYWAATLRRSLIETGKVPNQDWKQLYFWDGNNPPWTGRDVTSTGVYVFGQPVVSRYEFGLIWATTLMEIQDVVGKEAADRIVLQSLYYLTGSATYRDAAEAVLQANIDLYDGQYSSVILARFDARGYLDAADYGPQMTHRPLADTEDQGGVREIQFESAGLISPVDSVFAFYSDGVSGFTRIPAVAGPNDSYSINIPLPDSPQTVYYYLQSTDEAGRTVVLPAAAPSTTFSFYAGPDVTAPTITHSEPDFISLLDWPPLITTTVEDGLAVGDVHLDYEVVSGATGTVVDSGSTPMSLAPDQGPDVYSAFVPTDPQLVTVRDLLRYRIRAADASVAANEIQEPLAAEEPIEIAITAEALVRRYDADLDSPWIELGAGWDQGTPSFGVLTARSGTSVYATGSATSYSDQAGTSTMDLRTPNLSGFDQAFLTFWHWYDFEHNGEAGLDGRSDALLFDGGNVKTSVDGGQTWQVVEPIGGYTGALNAPTDNPMKGQRAFSAYSQGWRMEVIALPAASDLLVRFEAGTDTGNSGESVSFSGWYIDDIQLRAELQDDIDPPVAIDLPDAEVEYDISRLPAFDLQATDNVGVESVIAHYSWFTSTTLRTDSVRLSMDPADITRFTAELATRAVASTPGDRFEYHYFVRDFAGNVTRYPEDDPYFRIEFVLQERVDLLPGASATGLFSQTLGGPVADWASDFDEDLSYLLLRPIQMAFGTRRQSLVIKHLPTLGRGVYGNVKVSDDAGETWRLLDPVDGYPISLPQDASALSGEGVFNLNESEPVVTRFNLGLYANKQIRLRMDLQASPRYAADTLWEILEVYVEESTVRESMPRELESGIHFNFPEPFGTQTTIEYSLAEAAMTRLEIFDALGRRVANLVNQNLDAGSYAQTFHGNRLPAGLYIARLTIGSEIFNEPMMLVR